jgi:hypothetical protein
MEQTGAGNNFINISEFGNVKKREIVSKYTILLPIL